MACISVCAFIGLSRYSVERLSTSNPVSHIAHTIATRKRWSGFLKAVSTSTRCPPGVSKPFFITSRCGMMSKPHFLKSATSFCASLTTIWMIVSSIQSACCACPAARSAADLACQRGTMRWNMRAQVILSMHTCMALPDCHRVAQCSTKSAAILSSRSSAVMTS
jgi:hypothetical protein